ncbi:protein artichoke-like [Drosophila nasuta]|uniref:protein artichoke-like n=1 Tax=Drosophila nasuta TaxID=42062 RepID=UPI00295EA929|nr:protein artichoke-like [Drosophila nasuta]
MTVAWNNWRSHIFPFIRRSTRSKSTTISSNLSQKIFFENLFNLVIVHFEHNALTHLELPHMTYLRELYLGHNKLADFTFSDCPRLELLYLNDNQLTQLDSTSFQQLPELLELQLSGNLITEIGADTFQSLIKLRTLNLSRNALTSLPADVFGSSVQQFALQQLDLSHNNINVLFENQFELLAGLQMLNLSGNNIAVLKSAHFAGLTSLRHLHLQSNDKMELKGHTFATLKQLETLDLSHIGLDILDPHLFGYNQEGTESIYDYLPMAHMRKLNLSSNNLQHLHPRAFAKLSSLEELYLSNNALRVLPEGLFVPIQNLKKLDVSYNQFAEISSDVINSLNNITDLHIDNNRLTFLPNLNGKLRNVKVFRVSLSFGEQPDEVLQWEVSSLQEIARIESLSSIPLLTIIINNTDTELIIEAANFTLPNLVGIDLHVPRLELRNGAFANLPGLWWINMNDCGLEQLEKSYFTIHPEIHAIESNDKMELKGHTFATLKQLETLDLSHIGLDILDPHLFGYNQEGTESIYDYLPMAHMRKLNLSSNNLQHLHPRAFAKLSSLEELYLSNNALRVLPEGLFVPIQNLKKLDVSYNQFAEISSDVINSLNNITDLHIDNNRLTFLPNLNGKLRNVKVFREVSSLQEIARIESLSSIPLLTIIINNTDTELIIEAANFTLPNLVGIDLHVPRLELRNGAFANLPGLWWINMNDCGLEQLEKSYFTIHPEIHAIEVSHNKLKFISKDFFENLIHLVMVHLDHNSLTYLELPHMKSLRELYLGHNKLADFTFSYCRRLELLYLNDNQLTHLDSTSFQQLHEVLELQLSGNLITEIGADTFQSLIRLRTLNLSRNALTSLPADVFGSSEQQFALQQLDLSHNNINVLFENQFELLGGLQLLDLSGNKIATLKSAYFSGLHLQKLNVDHNLFPEITSDVLESLNNITDLLINNNQTFLHKLN